MIMRRYSNKEVALATGLTVGAITAYASDRGFSTKKGWTIPQVIGLLECKRRPRKSAEVDMVRVEELHKALIAYGWNYCGDDQVDGQLTINDIELEG